MKLGGKTNEELVAMMRAIEEDPANRMPLPLGASIHMYTPKARKKLDEIARQITYNMAVKRAAEGRPVPADGYSGRQTNRRR